MLGSPARRGMVASEGLAAPEAKAVALALDSLSGR
jgi:hypothetical protein